MTDPTFNLISEPFVPCQRTNGERAELGLRDLLVQAHELSAIRDDSPLVTTALLRLAVALVHATHDLKGVKGVDKWEALWNAGQLNADKIDNYFNEWSGSFDLFDADRPFYQAWPKEGQPWELPPDKRKGTNELAQELSGGNNAVLFDHTRDADSPTLSAAAAARYLIANQTFAAGGGVSATGSRTASPLVGKVVTTLAGKTLFHTLLLNAIPNDELTESLRQDVSPCWEREEPTFDGPAPDGLLDLYTWQPRRIRLHPRPDGTVASLSYAQGRKLKLPDLCFDPMTASKRMKKGGFYPLSFQDDRDVWRDAETLVQRTAGQDRSHIRPAVLDWLGYLVSEGIVHRDEPVRLICSGAKNDQAKIAYWRHETLPLRPAIAGERELQAKVSDAIGHADKVARRLGKATLSAAATLLSPGEGSADMDAAKRLIESLGVTRTYWAKLQPAFHDRLDRLGRIEPEDTAGLDRWMATWRQTVRRAAQASYEEAAGRLDRSARALQAVQAGRDRLRSLLYEIDPKERSESNDRR